jgi:hypothetical protein
VCAIDSGSTSDYIRAGGPAGGDLTGTYPNPQIAANAVGSAEIADNSVDMADTRNWMGSHLDSDYFGSADGRGYIYLYGSSFTPSADGSCMVIANAWIRSSSGGSASSGGSPTLGTFMNFIGDSYNRPDPTVPVPFSPGDVDDEHPITASATWVWAVTGGRATRFGCFVSDPDGIAGTDWDSDEYISCRISYICQ